MKALLPGFPPSHRVHWVTAGTLLLQPFFGLVLKKRGKAKLVAGLQWLTLELHCSIFTLLLLLLGMKGQFSVPAAAPGTYIDRDLGA